MIRTQIQIYNDQMKWLKQQAVDEGVSMAEVIRACITFYQDYVEKKRLRHQIKENALKVVGRFSSSD